MRCPVVRARGPRLPSRRAQNRARSSGAGPRPGPWAVSTVRAGAQVVTVGDELRGDSKRAGVPGSGVGRLGESSGHPEAGATRQCLLWESGGGAGVGFRALVGTPQLNALLHPRALFKSQTPDSLPAPSHPPPHTPVLAPASSPSPSTLEPVLQFCCLLPKPSPSPPGGSLAHPRCLPPPYLQPRASPALPASTPRPRPSNPLRFGPRPPVAGFQPALELPEPPFPGSSEPSRLQVRRWRQLFRGLSGGGAGSSWQLPAWGVCGCPGAPRRAAGCAG